MTTQGTKKVLKNMGELSHHSLQPRSWEEEKNLEKETESETVDEVG